MAESQPIFLMWKKHNLYDFPLKKAQIPDSIKNWLMVNSEKKLIKLKFHRVFIDNKLTWKSSTGHKENNKARKWRNQDSPISCFIPLSTHTWFIVIMCGEPLMKYALDPLLFYRNKLFELLRE